MVLYGRYIHRCVFLSNRYNLLAASSCGNPSPNGDPSPTGWPMFKCHGGVLCKNKWTHKIMKPGNKTVILTKKTATDIKDER